MFMPNDPRRDFLTSRLQYNLLLKARDILSCQPQAVLAFSHSVFLYRILWPLWATLGTPGAGDRIPPPRKQEPGWMCASEALWKLGGQVDCCLFTIVPVKWSWQWGDPHIKAPLSDVLVTWFALRIRPCQAQNELILLGWRPGSKRESKTSTRVVLLGISTVGELNFPHYVLFPNIKFLQHVDHIKKQSNQLLLWSLPNYSNKTLCLTYACLHWPVTPFIYSAYCPQYLEATSVTLDP